MAKEQEQRKELQQAEEKLKNQAEQQEYKLAERIYTFVKPFELYNYTDDTVALNSDEDNIEIVKADINDTRNISDYINALRKAKEGLEETDVNRHEIDVLITLLEKRVPHYEYHLGDTVYIGADEYEIAGITEDIVTLYDPKFPLFNKQIEFKEFEQKVKENYSNDHLRVENRQDEIVLEDNKIQLSNENEQIEDTKVEEVPVEQKKIKEEKSYKIGQEVYLESDRKYKIILKLNSVKRNSV